MKISTNESLRLYSNPKIGEKAKVGLIRQEALTRSSDSWGAITGLLARHRPGGCQWVILNIADTSVNTDMTPFPNLITRLWYHQLLINLILSQPRGAFYLMSCSAHNSDLLIYINGRSTSSETCLLPSRRILFFVVRMGGLLASLNLGDVGFHFPFRCTYAVSSIPKLNSAAFSGFCWGMATFKTPMTSLISPDERSQYDHGVGNQFTLQCKKKKSKIAM